MSVLTQAWQDLIMTSRPIFCCDVWGLKGKLSTVENDRSSVGNCPLSLFHQMINWYLIQLFRILLPNKKKKARVCEPRGLENRLTHYVEPRSLICCFTPAAICIIFALIPPPLEKKISDPACLSNRADILISRLSLSSMYKRDNQNCSWLITRNPVTQP